MDEERAVLRVDPKERYSVNGLLLPLENENDLEFLDERERGYIRQKLKPTQVEHFVTGTKLEQLGKVFLYEVKWRN